MQGYKTLTKECSIPSVFLSFDFRKDIYNHRNREIIAHLPVEEIEIHPASDLSEMVCIGKEITEELECEPARFFIKRYIRYKYTTKDGQGVKIGELPERVIDKGIPGSGLLASILTDKYMDHLPLYRQKQRFQGRISKYLPLLSKAGPGKHFINWNRSMISCSSIQKQKATCR